MLGDVGRKKTQTTTNSWPSPRLCVSASSRGPSATGLCGSGRKAGARHTCHSTTAVEATGLVPGFPRPRPRIPSGGPSKPRVCGQRPITRTVSPTPSRARLAWHNPSPIGTGVDSAPSAPSLGQTPLSSGRENWQWRSLRDPAMKH